MNSETTQRIEAALSHFNAGKPVIVTDSENRENEADLVYLAETITEQDIAFLLQNTSGIICVPCTEELLDRLEIPLMTRKNTARHGCAFTISVDAKITKTGVSAKERWETIQTLCNSNTKASDLAQPGHIFPLRAKESILERQGHTEAAVELCRFVNKKPIAVLAELMNNDGTMMRGKDLACFAEKYGILILTMDEIVMYKIQKEEIHQERSQEKKKKHEEKKATLIQHDAIHLPTAYGDFSVIPFEEENGVTHLAILKGDPTKKQRVLTRIHSECLTGDIFGSLRCDCGNQLKEALQMMEKEGSGIILYLRQEGRGIGLLPKLQAYHLQEKGFDTIEANELLGYSADVREYTIAVEILQKLNITTIRLLTNNPDKIRALESAGIHIVDRVTLESEPSSYNKAYLITKKEKMGHLLNNV